ncbi:Disease resistance RPP8-like protein 3 [Vitis vinifera]|uniref:Disease resistance RPP8-like protein 3 n=1 Tax=Vitis vinifera TaxID=29760 RepID=A0A438C960_VITVI|nr:Disease resistance RPP8-like protein 3 [Vitis vinifera]
MFLEREDKGGRLHSVLCCSRPASSWQYEMVIEFRRGHGRLQLPEAKGGGVEDDGRGRNEEAKEMRHRNSTMKMNDTPDWDTIDWAEVDDSKDLLKIVLSRVIEKLCVCVDSRTSSFRWSRRRGPMDPKRISRKAKEKRKLGESVANTVVSPVEEKVLALLAQEAIHPYTKKKAMRVLDKLSCRHVCLSAVVAIEDFINRTERLTKRSWMGPSKGFLSAFGKFKSQDKLAVEMDKIYAKIQNLSIHRPTAVNHKHGLLTDDESFQSDSNYGSDGCRLQLRNKEELMESDLSQLEMCGVMMTRCNDWKAFLINNRSLIVLDDSQLLYDMLEVLPDTLNGKDLVQPEGENETPEDVAERCLNLLIAQGMVQVTKKKLNGNVKMVRLPDALRQYWSSKAQQATFLGVHTNTRSELSLGTNKIRRLVDHLDKEDISFDHIHVLLVLDLENVFRPKLPEAIGKLTRLRYLGLRSTFLEILPSSISKLQNVQTLDMKHTCINALPYSIWKLHQLRHLHLSESCRSKLMLQHDTNIPTILQTLCGLLVDEETPVRDGLDRLLDIRKLGLTISSKQEAITLQLQAVVDWVLKLNQLRSLRLKSIDESNQPWDLELKPLVSLVNLSYIYLLGRLRNPSIMSQFPNSLIDLTLSGSGLVEDPMQSLDKLPNLRSLKLLAKSYLGKNMLCSLGGFPQLRVLKLWKLEQLEEWNVEKGALRALRDLEIRFCRSLKILPAELLHRTLLKIEIISAQAIYKIQTQLNDRSDFKTDSPRPYSFLSTTRAWKEEGLPKVTYPISTEVLTLQVKGDKSKHVLFDACRLAKSLQLLGTFSVDGISMPTCQAAETRGRAAHPCASATKLSKGIKCTILSSIVKLIRNTSAERKLMRARVKPEYSPEEHSIEQLEEWNVEKGALQALRDLEIRFCRSLNILPAELLHRTLLKIEVIPAQT